jgi:hypothetical protein
MTCRSGIFWPVLRGAPAADLRELSSLLEPLLVRGRDRGMPVGVLRALRGPLQIPRNLYVRASRGNLRKLVTRLMRGRGHNSPIRQVSFHFTDCRGLDHRLMLRDDGWHVRQAVERDPQAIHTTWAAYASFFSNERSAQVLFLDGEWSFYHGRLGFFDLEEVGPTLSLLEESLATPGKVSEALRNAVSRASAALGHLDSLDRIPLPPRRKFSECYGSLGKPFVATGATSDWSKASWCFEDLIATYGNHLTHLSEHPSMVFPIRDFLERVSRGESVGVKAALPLVHGLRAQCREPAYFRSGAYFTKARALIVAPPDAAAPATYAATSWHCDWADNFLVQLIGQKRVFLAPPSDASCFYTEHAPARSTNVAIDFSRVSPKRPDLRKYPAFARARIIECTLDPGDMLYLPCGWFHHVENLSPSCAINCWKVQPPSEVWAAAGQPRRGST